MQIRLEVSTHFRMAQRELDGRLQVTELAAAIEALTTVAISQDLLFSQQALDGVRQLQLAAGAGFRLRR